MGESEGDSRANESGKKAPVCEQFRGQALNGLIIGKGDAAMAAHKRVEWNKRIEYVPRI
jgi:hypothetical protein